MVQDSACSNYTCWAERQPAHVQCTFQAQNQRVVQPMLPTVQAHNRVAEPFSLPAVVPIAVPMAEPMAVPTAVPVGPAIMDPYQEEHQ